MRRLVQFLAILIFASATVTVTSCGSHRDNVRYVYKSRKDKEKREKERREKDKKENKDKNEKNKKDKGDIGRSRAVPPEWQTLDINLGRGDNRALYKEVKSWLGVPYLYGGSSKDGTDCSGFVMQVYKAVFNQKIERNSAQIFYKNCEEIGRDDLRQGDLIFFNTYGEAGRITHVGLYLKDNKFVHASSSRGVMVNDLDEKYYRQHYMVSGRVKH